jgi:hypothetical protein
MAYNELPPKPIPEVRIAKTPERYSGKIELVESGNYFLSFNSINPSKRESLSNTFKTQIEQFLKTSEIEGVVIIETDFDIDESGKVTHYIKGMTVGFNPNNEESGRDKQSFTDEERRVISTFLRKLVEIHNSKQHNLNTPFRRSPSIENDRSLF